MPNQYIPNDWTECENHLGYFIGRKNGQYASFNGEGRRLTAQTWLTRHYVRIEIEAYDSCRA